jgi:hypothetical protein
MGKSAVVIALIASNPTISKHMATIEQIKARRSTPCLTCTFDNAGKETTTVVGRL